MRLGRRAIGLCVALAGATAGAGSGEVARYVRAARGFYDALEYEHALEQLARAKSLPRSLDDDVEIALYEGIIDSDLSRTEDAINAFRAALYLKPDVKLPVPVSPKVEAVFEQTRAEVKAQIARGEPASADKPPSAAVPRPPPVAVLQAEPAPPRQATYRLALLAATANLQSLGLEGEVRVSPRWSIGLFGFGHATSILTWLYVGFEASFIPLGHFGNGLLLGGQLTEYAQQYVGQAQSPTAGGIGPHLGYRACAPFGLTVETKLRVDVVPQDNDLHVTLALAAGWSFL